MNKIKIVLGISIILAVFCVACFFFMIKIKQISESKQNVPVSMMFSIGDRRYFEFPKNIIVKHLVSEDETLFWASDKQQGNTKSVTDKFRLTTTVVHCLNDKLLQGTQISSGPSLVVNMLNGPFYLEINDTDNCIDLKVEDIVCYQINFTPISDCSVSSILQERGDRVILHDNMLDHTLIRDINETCMYPLNFKQNPLDVSELPPVSIVPKEMGDCEPLFLKARKAKCVFAVDNIDYALLVSVLRGYNSYIKLN